MTQRNKSKTLPKELPLCPGPKLNLFRHHDSPIEWIERLGAYGGTPMEGYVFRARIENREYAINVVSDSEISGFPIPKLRDS